MGGSDDAESDGVRLKEKKKEKKGRKKKRWKKGNVGLWLDGTMGSATHQGPSILDTQ